MHKAPLPPPRVVKKKPAEEPEGEGGSEEATAALECLARRPTLLFPSLALPTMTPPSSKGVVSTVMRIAEVRDPKKEHSVNPVVFKKVA